MKQGAPQPAEPVWSRILSLEPSPPEPEKIAVSCLLLLAGGAVVAIVEGTLGQPPAVLWFLAIAVLFVVTYPAALFLRNRSRIDWFHPMVVFSLWFFIPGFVIAAVSVALGRTDTDAGSLLVQAGDPDSPYRYRIEGLLVALTGACGLVAGILFTSRRFAAGVHPRAAQFLAQLRPKSVRGPMLLFAVGYVSQLLAISQGLLGYGAAGHNLSFASSIAFFGLLVPFSLVFLWCGGLTGGATWQRALIAALGALLALFLVSGARGMLFRTALVLFAADQYARPHFSMRRLIGWFGVMGISLVVGMGYGGAFREVRDDTFGRLGKATVKEETSLVSITFDQLLANPSKVPGLILMQSIERAAALQDLSIIVRYSEAKREEEQALGLDQNIRDDLLASFVPRMLWPDKPVIGRGKEIGRVYTGVTNHQPAITWTGDLYRNFGMPGVVIGMALAGLLLGSLYRLVSGPMPTVPGIAMYVALISSLNFEYLASTVIPELIRNLLVLATGLAFLNATAKLKDPTVQGTAGL